MKAADLKGVLRLTQQREKDSAMRDRLAGGAALTLMVGDGADAGAVVLARPYAEQIRADVLASLDRRIDMFTAQLAAFGVEG